MKNKPDDTFIHKKKWFEGLDSLRIILALMVMLSHFDNPFTAYLKSSSHLGVRLFSYFLANAFNGTAAVIAFFIISGFVIHYPHKNGQINLKKFWIRRFSRILIPLIVIYLVGIKFGHPEKAVIWSLVCELVYYAIYPLLIKIKLSWRQKFIFCYLLAATFIVVIARNDILSLVHQKDICYNGCYWQPGFFLTWVIGLPIWLLGVIMAEHIDTLKKCSLSRVLSYRIIVYVLSVMLCIGKFHLYLSYLLTMNIFALLLFKWLQAEIVYFKTKKTAGILEAAGKFSYSLYLCHPLIYVILQIWISSSMVTYPIFIMITVFIAYLFYLTVEKPAHLLAVQLSKNIQDS
ncbi:MAG TPA: acyltransferase [Mucilaginibacter sp.]|jgi:peptidoglycan/LPS O-acetylase OafA/YrhL|nr:acyltransferase [Mucilaginibacter sp.]